MLYTYINQIYFVIYLTDQILSHGVAPHLPQASTVLPVAQLPSHVFSTVDPTNQIIPVEQSSQNVDIVNQPVIVQQNGIVQESDQVVTVPSL